MGISTNQQSFFFAGYLRLATKTLPLQLNNHEGEEIPEIRAEEEFDAMARVSATPGWFFGHPSRLSAGPPVMCVGLCYLSIVISTYNYHYLTYFTIFYILP